MTIKAKILVVENDPESMEFLRGLLGQSGYQVVEATNGVQALFCAKAENPDLVLSDIPMSGMDGFEMAQKIRTDPALSQIPIIFYSAAYHEKQATRLCEACGISDRLEKPASPEIILKAVDKALSSVPPPLKIDPRTLSEGHTHLLSDKVASKAQQLQLNQRKLEDEINQRKKTEAVLQESEARYRSLVEDLPVGTFVCNLKEDRYLAVNPAMVAMLGYASVEEVLELRISRDLYRFIPECESLVAQVIAQRSMIGKEISWKRKDGSHILVRVSCRCSEDLIVEGIAEDITWQRELETQLRQTQKLESLGRLAGGVAHDFNNLLMALSGYADLLLAKLEPENPARNYADQIKKTIQRSAGLTRQLLAFSRKQVTTTAVIDVREFLCDINHILRDLLGPGIDLSVNTGLRPLYLEMDRNQLQQVIVNLAVNARDAMPNGGSILLEAFDTQVVEDSQMSSGWYVCLSVTDTGQGIEKHLQPTIFEPFFTTKGHRRTGLGLSTVYGIVKQAKGEIRVQSEPGQGTVFTIFLPLAAKPMVQQQVQATPQVVAGHARILLVDDEEILRLSMQEFLEYNGYTVVAARDGAQALDILSKENQGIQLMVTDLSMPGISGTDLARISWEKNPGLAVIFISGHMDSASHEFVSAHRAGTDYIEKPFPLPDLAVKIRQLLDMCGKCAPERGGQSQPQNVPARWTDAGN